MSTRTRYSIEFLDASFFHDLRNTFEQNRVLTRSLLVLIALQPHLANGREPSIDALSLPEEIITDPFSGDRLILKYTDHGPMIYSVGADLIDNGGDFTENRDIGLGPYVPPHP